MRYHQSKILFVISYEWLVQLMWNKNEMSQVGVTLTRVPLVLNFDLEFPRSTCISGMGLQGQSRNLLYLNQNSLIAAKQANTSIER